MTHSFGTKPTEPFRQTSARKILAPPDFAEDLDGNKDPTCKKSTTDTYSPERPKDLDREEDPTCKKSTTGPEFHLDGDEDPTCK